MGREDFFPPLFYQAKGPDQEPEQDRQTDGGDQTSGKKPPGVARIQTGDHERADIHADQEDDADKRCDLLWRCFSFLIFHFFHRIMSPLASIIKYLSIVYNVYLQRKGRPFVVFPALIW